MKPIGKNNYSQATISLDNRSLLVGLKPNEFNLELPENSDKKPNASVLIQQRQKIRGIIEEEENEDEELKESDLMGPAK